MKKWKKVLLIILLVIIAVIIGSVTYVQTQTYSPSVSAQQAAQKAEDTSEWLYFPSRKQTTPAVIFYPGALVEPESYSSWVEKLSEAGYPVYVLKMPLNLAVLAPNRAEKVLKEQPDRSYVIGGHSLGGVMASRFAADHPEHLRGVFFLASYPDAKGSLADKEIPVLSLTAENDHVLNHEAFEESKNELPQDTDYQEIPGGNHAGFGDYGLQKGDGASSINDQNQQVFNRLLTWMKNNVH